MKNKLFILYEVVILSLSLIFYLFYGLSFHDNNDSPYILLACTDPNCSIEISMFAAEDGTVTLIPIIPENTTLWIKIVDSYNFWWDCDGDIKQTVLDGTEHNYKSVEADKTYGFGKEVILRYNNDRSDIIAKVTLKINEFKSISNNICRIRFPHLFHWYSDTTYNVLSCTDEDLTFDDAEIINIKVDDNWLYIPLLNYTVSYPDLSLLHSGYDVRSIIPEASAIGSYNIWKGDMFFSPYIQYNIINDSTNDFKNNIIFILLGIGLSLAYTKIKGYIGTNT